MYEVIFDVYELSRSFDIKKIFDYRGIRIQGFPDTYIVVFNGRGHMSAYGSSDPSQSMDVFRMNPPINVQENILYAIDNGVPDDYIIDRYLQVLRPAKNSVDPYGEPDYGMEEKEEKQEGIRIDLFKTQFITIPNF